MKFFKFLLVIFITFPLSIKADLNEELEKELKQGGKLIFIRHAYAPGGGDPDNFDINDCNTQRNLNDQGKKQAIKIKKFFIQNKIKIDRVISSEWCRCKDTASLAFQNFETKSFLNSFFSSEFSHNRENQVIEFQKFLKNWDQKKNLIFVTHYVVISEILNYAPASGEIVISNKDLKIVDTLEIEY